MASRRLRFGILIIIMVTTCLSGFTVENDPVPYEPDEFPQWAHDVRRGSVITFGAVPVTLLLSRIFYDVGRFSIQSLEQGRVASEYAPLFFAPGDGVPLDETDRNRILAIGFGTAAVVAVIDYFLGVREDSE